MIVCDTGFVSSPTLPLPPDKWQELPDSAVPGYCTFPLGGSSGGKYNSDSYGSESGAWRPVGRHSGKTVVLYLSLGIEPILTEDLVGTTWGEHGCLFDDR